jgi:uncharacterized protein YsxB (DUF464 family)
MFREAMIEIYQVQGHAEISEYDAESDVLGGINIVQQELASSVSLVPVSLISVFSSIGFLAKNTDVNCPKKSNTINLLKSVNTLALIFQQFQKLTNLLPIFAL